MMDQKKINHYVDLLADNMALMGNYARFAGSSKKMLLVEGATDEKFIKKIINDDVWCVTAVDVFSNEDFMCTPKEQQSLNNKDIIIQVVYGLSVFPALINTKGLDTWKVYGMIDMDFDSSTAHTNTSKLFITDTHDLETLMLSTDKHLLNKIDKCTFSNADIQKSFFVSYQIGYLKSILTSMYKAEEFSIKSLSSGTSDVAYDRFVDDYRINIPKVIKFLSEDCNEGLSASKTNQIIRNVMANKTIKKRFNPDGTWKQSLEEFCNSLAADFWAMVNGHDILALLRYYNEGAKKVYSNSRGRSLNREFEMDLIGSYEYKNMESTDIYMNMKRESVVKPAFE